MNEEEKKQFIALIEEIKELRLRKSDDYGRSWRIYGLEGIIWQIKSKFIRMLNLRKSGEVPKYEPLRDTLIDMANYCMMGVQIIDSGIDKDEIDALLKIIEKENG